MSKLAETFDQHTLKEQIQHKLAELAELISVDEFGSDGPPKELTFREIESVGYQVAQLAAAKFEATATGQHRQHFEVDHPCPQCGKLCPAQGLTERQLLTRLGPVNLSEIEFHCNACRRSFFPSA